MILTKRIFYERNYLRLKVKYCKLQLQYERAAKEKTHWWFEWSKEKEKREELEKCLEMLRYKKPEVKDDESIQEALEISCVVKGSETVTVHSWEQRVAIHHMKDGMLHIMGVSREIGKGLCELLKEEFKDEPKDAA